MTEIKKHTALEELEEMGFELIFTEEEDGIDKLPFFVSFYPDGSWDVMTISHTKITYLDESGTLQTNIVSGGGGNDLGSGDNLISILPILRNIRDIYLKCLKKKKKSSLAKEEKPK